MRNIKLVNLTPHDIVLYSPDTPDRITPEEHEPIAVIPVGGKDARISTARTDVGSVDVGGVEVPFVETVFGEVEHLPEPEDGVCYIVSLPCANALRGKRDDLVVVDGLVRNQAKIVVGARGLGRLKG